MRDRSLDFWRGHASFATSEDDQMRMSCPVATPTVEPGYFGENLQFRGQRGEEQGPPHGFMAGKPFIGPWFVPGWLREDGVFLECRDTGIPGPPAASPNS